MAEEYLITTGLGETQGSHVVSALTMVEVVGANKLLAANWEF